MSQQNRTTLKTYFETGDTPTQAQFIDLIDSSPNPTDDGTTGSGSYVRATSPTLVTPALGTPSALVATNATGTASGLTAGNVTTNANLTGHVTSVGNAAVLGSFTKAQLDTAVSDGNVMYIGDAPTSHTHLLAAGATDVTASAAELNILDGATLDVTELNYVDGVTSAIQTQLNAKQALDSDLTTIAGLTATTDNFIQSKASAWASRTPTQVTADLIAMVGDSGAGGTKGLVPAPAAGDAAASKFLKADGTWTAPSGGGSVATDTIWDAKGDLAVGTGANTASRLAVGTNGQVLTADSAEATGTKWATISGTGDALVANPLSQFAATTSLQLKGVISDETGSGALVFATSPALVTPDLGTPSAAVLTNATGLPLASVVDSTTEALGVGSLELGHASDTTLSRVSAGVAAIEGNNILTTATGLPLAGGTMTGNITLAENASLDLDTAGSADGKYTGIAIAGTAGEALAFGDVIVLDVTAGKWFKGSVSAAAAADGDLRGGVGMCVLAAAGDASATKVLLMGTCRADANFPALTIGSVVYATTSGDITVTRPSTTDHVIKILGFALTADEIMFNPSMDWMVNV